MMPGRRNRQNHLTTGQRWAYLAGGAQWYGDLLSLLFLIFLLADAANLATGGGQLFRKLTVFLVSAVPVMVLLGLVRAIALLRRGPAQGRSSAPAQPHQTPSASPSSSPSSSPSATATPTPTGSPSASPTTSPTPSASATPSAASSPPATPIPAASSTAP